MFSSGAAFVLFKAIIGFGLPIAVGFHQLYLLKKDKEKGKPGPGGEPQIVAEGEPAPVVASQPVVANQPVLANQDEPAEERKAA
jgi:hypothetical protein